MANEFLKPMLDVGSSRVLNCNVMTRRIHAKEPDAPTFFRCKPLNNMVLIKDTDPQARKTSIGTKLYIPFNENDIYEGGRTIFVHDKTAEQSLVENFGSGALPKELLEQDMRVLKILDKLPSLDPFLLKDVFINEKIDMNEAYFEVSEELWNQIEQFILEGFEPLAKAAFPDAMSSDDIARKLIEKIWEGRDLEALKPLIMAFRIPQGYEMQTFASWKGVIYYGFEQKRATPLMVEMTTWLNEIKIPTGAITGTEREEFKATMDRSRLAVVNEWKSVNQVLAEYQSAYNKMFKEKTGSADFLKFLQNSNASYWTLGNGLGKTGHATYCWNAMSKRYPQRKMPWEQIREFIVLLSKIFGVDKKQVF